jgi:hypothetical protein
VCWPWNFELVSSQVCTPPTRSSAEGSSRSGSICCLPLGSSSPVSLTTTFPVKALHKENEGSKCPRWFGACLNFQQLTCVCERVLFDCSRRVLVVACSHWSERGGTDAGESDIQVRTSRGHELHAKWEYGMGEFSYLVLVKLWFTHN